MITSKMMFKNFLNLSSSDKFEKYYNNLMDLFYVLIEPIETYVFKLKAQKVIFILF
jgi:hypothetical protein